jgi:hypothetical protein
MANDKSTVISKIKSHVADRGGKCGDWYVGVASDPRQRLFDDHAVSEKGGYWVWSRCARSDDARAVEKHFLGLGMKGGPGGGDDESDCVYAYRITPTTKE